MSLLNRPIGIWIVTMIAIVFGFLTIKSGGTILFIDGEFRQQAGDYVPFVVWFNFLAGFAYLVAGSGLWQRQQWAVWLSFFIVGTTLVTFAIFGVTILLGSSYEVRTIAAMSFRAIVWIAIAAVAYREITRPGEEKRV